MQREPATKKRAAVARKQKVKTNGEVIHLPPPTLQGTVSSDELRKAIEAVYRAAAREEERPSLHSMLVIGEPDRLRFVCTDTYRMAECSCEWNNWTEQRSQVLVPRGDVVALVKELRSNHGGSFVELGTEKLEIDGVELKAVDAEFVDWQRFFTAARPNSVAIEAGKLREGAAMVKAAQYQADLAVREKAKAGKLSAVKPNRVQVGPVRLRSKAGFLEIGWHYDIEPERSWVRSKRKGAKPLEREWKVTKPGSSHEKFVRIGKGKIQTVAFNPVFLIDAIKPMPDDALVVLAWGGENTQSWMLSSKQVPSYRCVLMPIATVPINRKKK